jgi:hypothetical protein
MSNDGKSKPRPVKGANEGCETDKAVFHHEMTTWTVPANCDSKKGQDAIIALIGSLPQATDLLTLIQDFEKENRLPMSQFCAMEFIAFRTRLLFKVKSASISSISPRIL